MSVKALYDQLQHPDEKQRLQAVEGLAAYPSSDTTEVLIQALGDEEAMVIGAAMDTLTAFGMAVCPLLYHHLTTDTARVRLGIAELLERFPSPESEIALRSALEDSEAQVRGAAVRSLGGMTPLRTETMQAVEMLLTDPDSFPRYQALEVLQKVDPTPKREATILKKDLTVPSIEGRLAALTYIRDHHKTEWGVQVRALLKATEPAIQRAAQWTLERLGADDVDS